MIKHKGWLIECVKLNDNIVCNKLIQTSTIRILFVFGRIVASIICIWPNTTHPLFGTALVHKERSYHSYHLTSSHMISFHLNWVHCGCTHGKLGYFTAHSIQMKWGQMRWDEMRSYINAPLSFLLRCSSVGMKQCMWIWWRNPTGCLNVIQLASCRCLNSGVVSHVSRLLLTSFWMMNFQHPSPEHVHCCPQHTAIELQWTYSCRNLTRFAAYWWNVIQIQIQTFNSHLRPCSRIVDIELQ